MSDDDTRAELAEIEERIEHLRDVIESCRKGMLASRLSILAGGILFVLNLLGLIGPASLLLALLSFTAIIRVGMFVLARGITGITEASATYKPSMPRTRSRGSTTVPIAQVPTG